MWQLFAVSLVASAGFILWIRFNDRDLPYSSQQLQRVCDPQRAKEVVAAYPKEQLPIVYRGIAIDYGFMVAYATFFATACFLAITPAGLWRFGRYFAAMGVLAAVLDALEGIGLVAELRGGYRWAPVTCSLSRAKYALVGIVSVFLLARCAAWLFALRRT